MQVRRSESFTILITRSGSDRRSDVVRHLTRMMIQAHVTSDSSLLRATCENRLRPLRCRGVCRTEARAQCSSWPAFASLPRPYAISRARARLQAACELRCAGPPSPRDLRSEVAGIFRIGGAERAGSVPATDMMRLSGQFLTPHRPIGIGMPPRFTLGNGEANSLRPLSSRAGEISGSTLLDARLPPGLGIAALGGCACRSRAVEPDHAPTSKGWEHDLLPCAVPAAHARLSLKPRISHGSSATCKPS